MEKIFETMVQGAVRLPCACRRVTTGNMNARYCCGLTMDKQLMDSLDDSFSLETLTKEEALESKGILNLHACASARLQNLDETSPRPIWGRGVIKMKT
ncbi:MAG: hypothetical protein OHK003_12190 [Anaerolineales bacterium]